MKRRDALRSLGGALLGGATLQLDWLSACAASEPPPSAGRLDRIGLQLYTVRTSMPDDLEGTLAKVAEIGYREVEFAGYFGRSPQAVRTALQNAGLEAPAAHVPLNDVRDDWDKTLEAATVIGHQALIVPWIPEQQRTLSDFRAVADVLNRVGEKARAAGLRIGYHNHDFEFASVDGQLPYDVLLEATDPALVSFEMDLFWITKGGYRPLDYFARHPGRFAFVHVKDMTADGAMVDAGRGTIDFPAIFAKAKEAGIQHYFVEHDQPADPFASIKTSYEYLSHLKF